MDIKEEVTITMSRRQARVIEYCVFELLRVTLKHDLKEGFDGNTQREAQEIKLTLSEILDKPVGSRNRDIIEG